VSEPLNDEKRPPPGLKHRVITSLRSAGLLRAAPWRGWQPFAWAAVVVAAFAAGYASKSVTGTESAPAMGDRYALLLYSDSTFRSDGSAAERVAEYTEWARSLRARNRLELGERLRDSARVVSNGGEVSSGPRDESPLGVMAGMFIINASGMADAVALAATCPHVKYGGRIVVRLIAGSRL
jgi:hypothetical protein